MGSKGGAPVGNKNAGKRNSWYNTLDRAIAQDNADRLRKAAEQLLTQAAAGEQWAIKELADRLDGRAKQSIDVDANLSLSPEEWLEKLK
jgi:hypothetical protein